MKAVFLGATRGMGRALARACAQRGDELFLLGRDLEDLGKSCRDLEIIRGSGTVGCAPCDLARPESFAAGLAAARSALGTIDVVVVTAGVFATQQVLANDPGKLRELLDVDFTNTILFCEEARRVLLEQGGGTLCVFGSVAGDRARKSNFLYGAAKCGLSFYLDGLELEHGAAGLRVVTVKPGFVKTSMTSGLRPPPFAGEPEGVARTVLAAIDRKRRIVYAPWPWRWVMTVISLLPRFVMRRVGF